ncbi:MAG: ExbD/TolR family protein [Candidatus Baltobacteraceae bacterium]
MSLLSARGDEEVMAEINITPFTDVLLVLLIIFMILAALVTPPGFEKQLPNSSNSQSTASKNKQDIQIVVNDKGVIFVDSTKTDTKGIYRVMYDTIKKRGKKKISLTSDIKAPYGVIIRILDAANRAGDENVGFVTS